MPARRLAPIQIADGSWRSALLYDANDPVVLDAAGIAARVEIPGAARRGLARVQRRRDDEA
jgi:hypothetical protein